MVDSLAVGEVHHGAEILRIPPNSAKVKEKAMKETPSAGLAEANEEEVSAGVPPKGGLTQRLHLCTPVGRRRHHARWLLDSADDHLPLGQVYRAAVTPMHKNRKRFFLSCYVRRRHRRCRRRPADTPEHPVLTTAPYSAGLHTASSCQVKE